ncbi:(-)-germacrene D synthase-like isoform X2 [Vicia villosa]|uniref:(-)-germacrene D synthase-like isoform X2 n=1 Tax=Vicia villosa TaxID=3911 RepID=UPI00273B75A0|nr:(-)-germacrene D synthase-like isoform X2 [Vicia villosa]
MCASASNHNAKSEVHRNVADFQPSVWGDYFLRYASESESMELDPNIVEQIEMLKNDVKSMLGLNTENSLKKVYLIDSICRLGLGYHFEPEIEDVLQHIYKNYVKNGEITIFEDNIYSLAVLFRLLRQQGFNVLPNVFNKFKDEQGNFSERLIENVEGMLSLYEATHLMVHGEDVLEEALAFTISHLEPIANQLNNSHAKQVKHSLRHALHRNLPRLEARSYISIYEQDPSHNKNLLILAKLDFNTLQRLHQKEISNICKWWKEFDLSNKLPYVRDRIVECYFWALGVFFEPQYSKAREIMTKQIIIIMIIDDTYDAYGTIDEWDNRFSDNLPEYLKSLYKKVLNIYDRKTYALKYYVKELIRYVQAHMTEAKWLSINYQPTLEEYIHVSAETSSCLLLVTTCYIGMEDTATEDIFQWVSNRPKIINASIVIGRLLNDIVTNEFEQKRQHISSFLECYMRQYNVSKEVAIQEARKRISNAWKDINKEFFRPTDIPMPFLKCILNALRFLDVIYKDRDIFTHPEGEMKILIKALLVDPVPI